MTPHDLRCLRAIARGHYATQGTPRRIARYIAAGWVRLGKAGAWEITEEGRRVCGAR